MVSPAWDLAFIVASPVLIVPALWWLTRYALTPEQVAIPVFAFATLGHHLPGYMRAYGDRDLFRRFRLRFVVVPPLLFGAVLVLVDPALFGASFAPPSSLQLLLVLWGAWHGLMQIYGFMRIYDAKQGGSPERTRRLDLAVCFAIFVAGFLYSDARSFALFDLVLRAGLPAPGPEALAAARWLFGVLLCALTVSYVADMVAARARGRRASGVKLALAASTAGIYTYSGLVTTNILLGGAVFEVFHAVQYLAIVWYFNRRLEDRVGQGFGPLRFLFRDRWSSLLLYLFAVAGFGSMFLVMGTPQYGPIRAGSGTTETLYVLFSAFFVTSSLLHYYYDGFIWKLHDRATASTLGLRTGLSEMSVPALAHFAKWAGLAAGVAVVIALELTTPQSAALYGERIETLAKLTPEVPELRRQLVARALAEGHLDEALALAEQNVAVRPRTHDMYADLGRVQVAREAWAEAETAYRRALELRPSLSVYRVDLARVIARQGPDRADDASDAYAHAIEARPGDEGLLRELAQVEVARGKPEAAVLLLEPVLEADPTSEAVREQLVTALLAEGRRRAALDVAREGTELAPDSAPAHRLLGAALRSAQRPGGAAQAFGRAQEIDPELPGIDFEAGQAWFTAGRGRRAEPYLQRATASEEAPSGALFLLGLVYYRTEREPFAEVAWSRFVELAPEPAEGHRRLAARLAEEGEASRAIAAYREALRLAPDDAGTHYGLARLLLGQGDARGAREEMERATELGYRVSPAMWAQLR